MTAAYRFWHKWADTVQRIFGQGDSGYGWDYDDTVEKAYPNATLNSRPERSKQLSLEEAVLLPRMARISRINGPTSESQKLNVGRWTLNSLLANPFGVGRFFLGFPSFSLGRWALGVRRSSLPLQLNTIQASPLNVQRWTLNSLLANPFGVGRFFLLFAFTLALAPSARAMSPGADDLLASSSITGFDCITADAADEQPVQVADKSSQYPDSSDFGPSISVDRATLPARTNKKPIHFSETHFELVIIHELPSEAVLLFPIHCFYCLHEHIRERAPPSRRSLGQGGPCLV